jgi:hypothetical protein
MAQWLRALLVLYHMIRNEEFMGSILMGVNCFFLQLWLIFYVILHVNWPVESIIKSHESSACAFENLASFHQVKKLKKFKTSGIPARTTISLIAADMP